MEKKLFCVYVFLPVILSCNFITDYKLMRSDNRTKGYYKSYTSQHVMDCGKYCKTSNPESCLAFAFNKIEKICYVYDFYLILSDDSEYNIGIQTYTIRPIVTDFFPEEDGNKYRFLRFSSATKVVSEDHCRSKCASSEICLYYTIEPLEGDTRVRCMFNQAPYLASFNVTTENECNNLCLGNQKCQASLKTSSPHHPADNCFLLSDPAIKGCHCSVERCKLYCMGIPACLSIAVSPAFPECLLFNKRIEEIAHEWNNSIRTSSSSITYVYNKII